MIPRFSNPLLLVQDSEIVSRVDIDPEHDANNTPLDPEETERLAVLERIVKRSLGDLQLGDAAETEKRKKRRRVEDPTADEAGPSEEPIPFRLLSASTSLKSLKSKPRPKARAVDRPVEDDESEAAIRALRAAAVAVDASQIVAEARVPGYPRHDAGKKAVRVAEDVPPGASLLLVELPKTQTASSSLAVSMLKIPEKTLPNPHDFPADKLCCPALMASSESTASPKKRSRRRARTRPQAPPHPVSFWRPPQELGGKSRGYAMGYVGSRPIPTGSVRQWGYRRDRMRNGVFTPRYTRF